MPVPDLAEMLPPLGIALPPGSSLQGGFASAAIAAEEIGALVTASGSWA